MKKILVVEDEYYARKSIVKILQESDLDIQVCGEAENGMKAIELLEEYKDIALVITDIQMQKMGGLELASYLHKHIPEIDVLILTAFENFDYAREALRYNVKDYIVKPIYKENLLPPVKKVLEKQEEKSRNQEKIKNYYQWEAAKNYFPVKTIVAHEELYKEFFSYNAIHQEEKFCIVVMQEEELVTDVELVNRIIQEKYRGFIKDFFFSKINEEYVMLLSGIECMDNELIVQEKVESMLSYFCTCKHMNITMGVGLVYSSKEKIYQSYNEALRQNLNKERTILYLFSINAIIYIASGFYTPFLSAYYAQKGIDAEKIGILLMIGPCVVLLTQRFWAKISDRTGKRKEVLLVTIVGSGFSMLLYYLGNSFLCMFFATVVVTSFTTAVIPLSDAILIARSLKEGYSYSIIRLGGTLGYAVMTICAGMYLKTRPQMQFVFAFFAYMILFCFCIGLKEERNGQIVINEVVQENEQNRIFKNRDVYIVLGLAFVSQMGLSFYTGFIGPYILEKGYTQSTIGVINSISALSEVPVLFYINRMLRKHGTIKILFLSCFLMGIRILLPIRSGIIGIVLAQLLQGVTYMTMYYSCAVYISTCVYEKYQTKGQSILNVVQLGLGAIVGNLVGGKLIRLLGYEKGYLLMAGITTLMTICALIVYFWKNREQRNGGDVCEI